MLARLSEWESEIPASGTGNLFGCVLNLWQFLAIGGKLSKFGKIGGKVGSISGTEWSGHVLHSDLVVFPGPADACQHLKYHD